MKAAIVICLISIIGALVGLNLMSRSETAPAVHQTSQTTDVPH
jgi:hypothetical protein